MSYITIQSETDYNKEYTLTIRNNIVSSCTCPAYHYSKSKFCKHMEEYTRHRRKQEKLQENEVQREISNLHMSVNQLEKKCDALERKISNLQFNFGRKVKCHGFYINKLIITNI